MTNSLTHITVNPFFAARMADQRPAVFAKLPQAPLNASPVPGLTSLYHNDKAGDYGDRRYPGNCGGNLIRDLLCYFQPRTVFDPLTGSGTCRDVCRELDIDCLSHDLRTGFDACDPAAYGPDRRFDFVWLHPPYWRQKVYSQDPRDLSTSPRLSHFLSRYESLLTACTGVLAAHGKLAVLMGDYFDRESGFVPLVYHTQRLAFAAGLRQHCTGLIRFSHGAASSHKVYRSAFIPGLHDICLIFERAPG